MSRWTVRRAGPDDEEAVIAMEAQSFGAQSWGPKNVRASLKNPRTGVLLACDGAHAPQGYALWLRLGEEAELLSMGVVPAARRCGAGLALLRGVFREARAAAARRLFLEAHAHNEAALALYRAAGFETLNVRKRYYCDGADAIVMQIAL
jgi:ribosomal protein S18 acetylase RimI-like enzyme